MEQNVDIPIWFNGTQRWMTGLTKRTTCDDVIYALLYSCGLHESQSTDKYSIFEKWREVERPLSARTKLLKVWKFWAQEQPNVELCMRSLDDYFIPGESNLYMRSRRRNRKSSRHRLNHTNHCRCHIRHGYDEFSRFRSLEQLVKIVLTQERKLQSLVDQITVTEDLISQHEDKIHKFREDKNKLNSEPISYTTNVDNLFPNLDFRQVAKIFPHCTTQELEDIVFLCDDVTHLENRLDEEVDRIEELEQQTSKSKKIIGLANTEEEMSFEIERARVDLVRAVTAQVTSEYREREVDKKLVLCQGQLEDKIVYLKKLQVELDELDEQQALFDVTQFVYSQTQQAKKEHGLDTNNGFIHDGNYNFESKKDPYISKQNLSSCQRQNNFEKREADPFPSIESRSNTNRPVSTTNIISQIDSPHTTRGKIISYKNSNHAAKNRITRNVSWIKDIDCIENVLEKPKIVRRSRSADREQTNKSIDSVVKNNIPNKAMNPQNNREDEVAINSFRDTKSQAENVNAPHRLRKYANLSKNHAISSSRPNSILLQSTEHEPITNQQNKTKNTQNLHSPNVSSGYITQMNPKIALNKTGQPRTFFTSNAIDKVENDNSRSQTLQTEAFPGKEMEVSSRLLSGGHHKSQLFTVTDRNLTKNNTKQTTPVTVSSKQSNSNSKNTGPVELHSSNQEHGIFRLKFTENQILSLEEEHNTSVNHSKRLESLASHEDSSIQSTKQYKYTNLEISPQSMCGKVEQTNENKEQSQVWVNPRTSRQTDHISHWPTGQDSALHNVNKSVTKTTGWSTFDEAKMDYFSNTDTNKNLANNSDENSFPNKMSSSDRGALFHILTNKINKTNTAVNKEMVAAPYSIGFQKSKKIQDTIMESESRTNKQLQTFNLSCNSKSSTAVFNGMSVNGEKLNKQNALNRNISSNILSGANLINGDSLLFQAIPKPRQGTNFIKTEKEIWNGSETRLIKTNERFQVFNGTTTYPHFYEVLQTDIQEYSTKDNLDRNLIYNDFNIGRRPITSRQIYDENHHQGYVPKVKHNKVESAKIEESNDSDTGLSSMNSDETNVLANVETLV